MSSSDPHARFLYPEKITSLTSYLRALRRLTQPWFESAGAHLRPWFRGHMDGGWPLIPSVYRETYARFSEERCRTDFKLRAIPFLAGTADDPKDDWDWYFVMQHHGLPTRLLDWSENPLVALYFALRNAKGTQERRPAVWVLNPGKMNQMLTQVGDLVVLHTDEAAESYLPHNLGTSRIPPAPIAIQPPHNSRRLTAQKGTFTLHGSNRGPLEEYEPLHQQLVKLEISRGRIEGMRWDLAGTGITETYVFPELPSLCQELLAHWTRSTADLSEKRRR